MLRSLGASSERQRERKHEVAGGAQVGLCVCLC
eukprot:COSAG03_NODE_24588_length_271_cov_0.761628_1_plen_32_part_01